MATLNTAAIGQGSSIRAAERGVDTAAERGVDTLTLPCVVRRFCSIERLLTNGSASFRPANHSAMISNQVRIYTPMNSVRHQSL